MVSPLRPRNTQTGPQILDIRYRVYPLSDIQYHIYHLTSNDISYDIVSSRANVQKLDTLPMGSGTL